MGDVLAINENLPGVRLEKPHNGMQRDRFTHTTAAQDAERFPIAHIETHIVKHAVLSERFADMLELDVGTGCR